MHNLNMFSGSDTPGPRRSVLDAWTKTLISSWLAGVPIVPVLRKDHWDKTYYLSVKQWNIMKYELQRCVYVSFDWF